MIFFYFFLKSNIIDHSKNMLVDNSYKNINALISYTISLTPYIYFSLFYNSSIIPEIYTSNKLLLK